MRHTLILLLTAACGASAFADAPKSARTCRILFLDAPHDAPRSVYLSDGSTFQRVDLPRMNLSDIYQLPPGKLALRMFSKPPVEGEPLPTDGPMVTVGESLNDFYLLVSSNPAAKDIPLRMQTVNASSANFRKGQMLWFNLSPYQVIGKLGSQSLNMKPNSRTVVDAPMSGFEEYPVRIGYLPESGKRAEPICSTVWQHDADARSIVFVINPPSGRIPQIRGFIDSRTEPKPQ